MTKHGVKVILGSDMFGEEVKFTLANIISASEVPGTGYTSLDIMKMTTSVAGEVCAMSGPGVDFYKAGKLGVIEKGTWADILIVDGNPIKDVKLFAKSDNVKLVMKDRHIYKNIMHEPDDPNYIPVPKEFRID